MPVEASAAATRETLAMSTPAHRYATQVVWEGNLGEGTASYDLYGRAYRVLVVGKPDLPGSADPAFRGDADRHNPEELFLAALSACHMLVYLALCARRGLQVVAYEDAATARLELDVRGGGRIVDVTLRPEVTIASGADAAMAAQLHEDARARCFLASSCAVPIRHAASVKVARP